MAESDGRTVYTATIASSTDESGAVTLGADSVLAIEFQTGANTFDATTAYVLFKASHDGSTYNWIKDKDKTIWAVQVVATTNTTGWVYVPAEVFAGARFVKAYPCSDNTGTAVTQTAARTIKLICGKLV